MKTPTILALVLATATAAPVLAQDAPAGAAATGCDMGSYKAVRSERTGDVLYWTNSSCGQSKDNNNTMMMNGGIAGAMNGGMNAGMNGGMGGM